MTLNRLQIAGVDKVYGGSEHGVHAVKGLSMNVAQGDIVALLGSSGCGKTSTLRMIAGFETVSSGSIRINDKEIHKLPPVRRNVAITFEGYSLYPPLTVRENIAFALESGRQNKQDIARRVSEIAQLLEIEDILDRYPSSISGGQQQRASLGRALIRDADLYLLDEPMGQLEPQLRALLRGRLKHFMKQRGLTAILVTHDQTEANALADVIAVMEDGVLQQYDTPEVIKNRPVNLFSGTFMGEPPMNIFNASATIDAGQLHYALDDGSVLRYPVSEFSDVLLNELTSTERLVLGVRPYAVKRAESGLPATVIANQWLGDQTHLASRFAGGSMVLVEHDRTRLSPGSEIQLQIGATDLHVFDAQSGRAMAHGADIVR